MATQYPFHHIVFAHAVIQRLCTSFAIYNIFIFAAPLVKQSPTNFNQIQLYLLQPNYDAIKSSAYDALVLQTRFKPSVGGAGNDSPLGKAANDSNWHLAA